MSTTLPPVSQRPPNWETGRLKHDSNSRGGSVLPGFLKSFFSKKAEASPPLLNEHEYVSEATQNNLPSSKLAKEVVKVDKKGKEILSKGEPAWSVTGPSAEYNYVIGDIPGVYRQTHTLVSTIKNQPPPSGLHGLGMMSGVSVLTGYSAVSRGYVDNKKANKINDYWGKFTSRVTMARGGFETAGGIAIVPFRALSLAAVKTGAKTTATAAAAIGSTAFGLFGMTYLLLAVPSAISFAKGIGFNHALKKVIKQNSDKPEAEQLKQTLEFLQDQLSITREEHKELATQILKDPKIYSGEFVKEIEIDPEDAKLLSAYDQGYVKGFIENFVEDTDDVSKARLGEHVKRAFIHALKRKEAELARKSDRESVALIKEEMQKPLSEQLVSRLNTPDSKAIQEAKELINKVKGNTKFNIKFNFAVVFFCVLGAVAFAFGIVGIVGTGGILALAMAATWVVVALGMLAIDSYMLFQAWKKADPAFKDKIMMSLGGGLLLLSVILGSVFSGGLVPLVASLVAGVVATGLTGYSYYNWKKQTKEGEPRAEEGVKPFKEKLA